MTFVPNQLRVISFPRLCLIILAFIISLAAGLSSLLFPSHVSPLFIAGAILVVAIILVWFDLPVLALCSALLVVFLPDGLLPATIHSQLNRTLTIAAIVIWAFSTIRHSRRIVLTGAAYLMIGFLLWSIATVFWSDLTDIALISIQKYSLRFLLFIFLFPNMIRSGEALRWLMKTISFSGWLLALVAIVRLVTTGYTAGSRLDVLAENENALGIGLLISLVGVIWLTLHDRSRYRTINHILSYIFLVFAIFITAMSGSRGSAISLVVTLILFVFWKPTRRWGLLGLLCILTGLMVAPIAFTTTLERFAATRGDTMLGGREALWQAAWSLIQKNMWIGVGIGNSPYAVLSYVRFFRSILGKGQTAIHNPVLVIWAETGFIGLLLYLGIPIAAVGSFVKQYLLSRNIISQTLSYYFPLLAVPFFGYMLSWIKGGGMESEHTYFLMLALLTIPAVMDKYSGDAYKDVISDVLANKSSRVIIASDQSLQSID